jgi:hypothetical protein
MFVPSSKEQATMSENKTQPTEGSVDDFLGRIADDTKRADSGRLRELMEAASGEPAVMWGSSIIGFGNLHYRYESGREGDTPAIGFSPRASSITLYIAGGFDGLGPILERLGNYKTGKGCLYIKRLGDVDEGALIDLIDTSLDKAAELNVAP